MKAKPMPPMQEEPPINEFGMTLRNCILSSIVAIVLGCIIGYGLLIMIGQETDLTLSNRYMDRVYATRVGFVQQSMEFQQAADALRKHPSLRVLHTRGLEPVYVQDRTITDAPISGEFADAVRSLFVNSDTGFGGQEDVTEELITDLRLHNIAVDEQGHVFFYVYYDDAGYICIAYDENNTYATDKYAVALMEQWYILFEYQEVDA